MSILLADDDVDLATFLAKSLESEGYAVHTAPDEQSVRAELQRQNYKLIILDLNFGPTDGLNLLEQLRAEGLATPVLVLSARTGVSDRIKSLNLGADDYVVKPFSFQELAARANAILRRKVDPELEILRVEDLELNPRDRKVTRGDREIKLSPKEFELLNLLMRRAGNTVSRQELLDKAWGLQPETDSNLVDVYVNYLRKKIDFANEEKLIFTVRGSGYRLGPIASPSNGSSSSAKPGADTQRAGKSHSQSPQASGGPVETVTLQQSTLRALVNSVAHDLAQPLTSVRCFLEVAGMKNGSNPQGGDLKSIEQQADRAIALAKTLSSLAREVPAPSGPWVSLDTLLQEVFNDFIVLLHSGMLTLERQWDPTIQVTSSPVLRQLLVLLVGKLVGRNTRPLTMTVSTNLKGSKCNLELRWRTTEPSQGPLQDVKIILGKELPYINEMVYSIGGELVLESDSLLYLRLPAGKQDLLQ
ncbi:MAG TPA: winged helix-turn-helix domain-containing protein [Candidatus Angelobacter sp.]|nr:winged helix-turn-helix domain-containing protein [Candidatus Angelobacter sp.]